MSAAPRRRLSIAALIAVTIPLGLATRPLRDVIGPEIAGNLGDALWAMCAYLAIAFVWPRARWKHVAITALCIAFAVECSQLYHAPWIAALRATTPGGLLLGWGFAWGDLACYALGVAICAAIDRRLDREKKRAAPRSFRSRPE